MKRLPTDRKRDVLTLLFLAVMVGGLVLEVVDVLRPLALLMVVAAAVANLALVLSRPRGTGRSVWGAQRRWNAEKRRRQQN